VDEERRIYGKVKSVLHEKGKRSSYIGEDDFVSLFKAGITINFHIKHPSLDIENTFRVVKRTQKIIQDKFDYALENIQIEIYNSLDEMRKEGRSRSRYASWIAGIFDGKIRIVSERESEDPSALYIILTHEISHLAIFEITKGQCPYWLDEGLAVYLSQELSNEYFDNLLKAVKYERIIPLETLEKPSLLDTSEELRHLAYAESFSVTEYLIETYGWSTLESILMQCRRRPFKDILGNLSLNYYLIERAWQRWFLSKRA
jgi:hypothetical protein